MNKIKLTISSLLIFYTLSIFAQTSPKSQSEINAEIDEYYKELMDDLDIIGASIAIIENGKIVHAQGYGFADLENQIKASPETVYPIGSTTKTLTAFAIMQLYEKGLLDINESIKKYIPELTIDSRFNDGNKIYIKDILSHTSGLPSDVFNGMAAQNPPDMNWLIEQLNQQTTITPYHTIDAYSNVGYGLLGVLIERVSGMSYGEYLEAEILKKLNMNDSSISTTHPNISKGYIKGKEMQEISAKREKAAGAVTSSVLDMAQYVNMLINDGEHDGEQILSSKHITAIETNHLQQMALTYSEQYGYGMSIFEAVFTDKNGQETTIPMYGHSGYSPPFHADIRYIPSMNLGVVVMVNTKDASIIRSAGTLISAYLEVAKDKEYRLRFQSDLDDNSCSETDILGVYNMGMSVFDVKNPNKIKLKVDGTKVVLKRIEQTSDYSITAKLLGVIPIKAKGVIFRFKKRAGNIYIAQIDTDLDREEYVGAKTTRQAISSAWQNTIGSYDIVESFKSSIPEFDFSSANVTMKEEKGFLYLEIKTPKQTFPFYLNIDSDKVAYAGGMSRHMGYLVRILDNGNLYFSGFEFQKTKS